jgi:hypothetical protein
MAESSSTTSQYQRHLMDWCIWKVLLPFLVLLVLWPIYRFVGQQPDAFNQAFEHGDLLIFAALLFIEVAIESAEGGRRSMVVSYAVVEGSKLLAMLLLFVLGFIKYDILKGNVTDEKRLAYSVLSVSFGFLAVCLSLWSLHRSIFDVTSRELEAAGVEPE